MQAKDTLPPGKRLGHYEITGTLGEGGMGVVYKARDTHLDRFVALKTLRHEVVANSDRRRRFAQEAKAASALNHPNIVHIYDIDTQDGIDYIAMELVSGSSLSRWVKSKRPSMKEALDCSVQAAGALDAAHRAGIIHRDLKPANIMITGPTSPQPGLVKILDFGLAKLIEVEAADIADAPTLTEGSGGTFDSLVGTPGYMSPEQVSGTKVDQRSDIFSFGLVLYFLATGQNAFRGATGGLQMASILRDDPPAPSELAPDTDPGFEAVILRCIRKDPNRRYQSMVEVKIALEDLKDETVTGRRSGSFAQQVLPKKAFPWRSAIAGVILVAAIGVGVWLGRKVFSPKSEPVLDRLTADTGLSIDPAISRDAKLLAYASDRAGEGNLDIWVRQIGGGDPIRITHDPADDNEPDFSPDGTLLAFHSDRDGGGVYVVPALGGQERRLGNGGRRPRFSPDGKRIAYWTGDPFAPVPSFPHSAAIFIVDPNGGQPRRWQADFAVATRPLWTPDGASILFWGRKEAEGNATPGWWVAPAPSGAQALDGTAVPVTVTGSDFDSTSLQWSEPSGWRGTSVVFSKQHNDNTVNVYEAPFSFGKWQIAGPVHRLTFGTTQEESPSVAADGSLVFAAVAANSEVYQLSLDAGQGKANGPPERLTHEMADAVHGSLSADGRFLVFSSFPSGQWKLWIRDLVSGKENRLLTSGAQPALSPDGATVAFFHEDKPMTIPAAGGVSRVISSRPLQPWAWTPDQTRLVAFDASKPRVPIEIVDVASGSASVYLAHPRYNLYPQQVSADGRWIAFSALSADVHMLIVAPFRPSAPPKEEEWITITDSSSQNVSPHWSSDGRLLYLISDRDGFACIWARRLDAATQRPVGEAFPVLHLHGESPRIRADERYLSVAKNKLALSLEERTGNIWMLRFK